MTNKKLLTTVMATEIIEAFVEDEKEGYDIAAGLFGAAFSKVVRNYAQYIDELQQENNHLKLDNFEWKHCTPTLLSSGVNCATTTRRACQCDFDGSHDHWVKVG